MEGNRDEAADSRPRRRRTRLEHPVFDDHGDLPKAARPIDLIAEPERLEQVVQSSVVGGGLPMAEVFATAPLWPVAIRTFDVLDVGAEAPSFTFGNPWALCGPNDDVSPTPGSSYFDVGVQLGAIIGLPGRNITEDEAWNHIAGFVLVNDWAARDLARTDTATTLGPLLVTPDELPEDLSMTGRAVVNGHTVVSGSFGEMAWSFASLISFASRGTCLGTGDLLTGGPLGGTRGRAPLQVGDIVTVSADVLGEQACTIAAPEALHPINPQLVAAQA